MYIFITSIMILMYVTCDYGYESCDYSTEYEYVFLLTMSTTMVSIVIVIDGWVAR